MHGNKWVAIMMGAAGNAIVYRESAIKAAGFDTVPQRPRRLPQAVPGAQGEGHAVGLRARQRDRRLELDALARVGARRQARRRQEQRRHQQPRDDRRARVRKQLYDTFIPGTLSWLDPNNNKAFLDGQLFLTANGISVYYAAKTSQDPKLQEMANDIQHAYFPVGVDGKTRELNLVFPMMIFKYSKYPNAAKEYLRFMMEREQYVPWQEASIGYVCHPLAAYEKSAFWTEDPKKTPYRDCFKNGTPGGYAGRWATRRRRASRTSSSRTWSPKRRRDRRRRRKRRRARRRGRSGTTRSDVCIDAVLFRAAGRGSATRRHDATASPRCAERAG